MSLRDRLLTPAGARAVTAPSAVLLAGVAASAGILGGLALPVAAAVGVGAYALRVLTRLPKGPVEPAIEPRRLGEPWASYVREAQDAQARFARAVRQADAGAIRERLTDIGRRLDDGVRECWRIAGRGHELDQALRQLEHPAELRRRLALLDPAPGSTDERVAQSLGAQIASTERIHAVAVDASERLRLLDARLDEAVARAVELSLRTGAAAGDAGEPTGVLHGLGSDVDSLVADMEALRQALEETTATTPRTS